RITTGGYDAAGNSIAATGDPFASFLLGQVQTANYQIPAFTTWNGGYHAGYVNDDFKVTSKLTVTFGQLAGHLEIVVDVAGMITAVPRRERRDLVVCRLHLAQQERSERVAGRGNGVTRGVVTAGGDS